MIVLCATLIVEMPVLLMITGGSDALCGLIGKRRFYLLIGMLLLNNAISGNVGLQASSLTARAITHSHITVGSCKQWFVSEVGAAAYLGLGMGCLLGSIALFASEMDFAFALTIMIAQFISIVTAGITGTFAPLLFSFVFKHDSGKWGGPLNTAFQDIAGTFAMVVVSYYLLSWFSAGNVDPNDSCGSVR
jgi:Mg/Co/Ni transporter MgtE